MWTANFPPCACRLSTAIDAEPLGLFSFHLCMSSEPPSKSSQSSEPAVTQGLETAASVGGVVPAAPAAAPAAPPEPAIEPAMPAAPVATEPTPPTEPAAVEPAPPPEPATPPEPAAAPPEPATPAASFAEPAAPAPPVALPVLSTWPAHAAMTANGARPRTTNAHRRQVFIQRGLYSLIAKERLTVLFCISHVDAHGRENGSI